MGTEQELRAVKKRGELVQIARENGEPQIELDQQSTDQQRNPPAPKRGPNPPAPKRGPGGRGVWVANLGWHRPGFAYENIGMVDRDETIICMSGKIVNIKASKKCSEEGHAFNTAHGYMMRLYWPEKKPNDDGLYIDPFLIAGQVDENWTLVPHPGTVNAGKNATTFEDKGTFAWRENYEGLRGGKTEFIAEVVRLIKIKCMPEG